MTNSPSTDATARPWRYEIQYGPNGEKIYAWVYYHNLMVCTAKVHHARLIVEAVNAYEPLKARLAEAQEASVELQRHRDHWRGYAYGKRDRPLDFLDGNLVDADRPQTMVERALAAEDREAVAREDDAEFRSIPGYPGYAVSNDGRLKKDSARGRPDITFLTPLSANGYLKYSLRIEGKVTSLFAHRAVALAWIGSPPNGKRCVAHLDGDRRNNHVSNLEWVSYMENAAHKRVHGTHISGEKAPAAKLTEQMVADARTAFRCGETIASIARKYGVTAPTMRDVITGASWGNSDLFRPAEPVEAKWRPIETAPKEDPERPGRDFEIIVGGGEIKDESADLLPWRPFDSWSLACYDSMRGCWRGEQTEQYDCFYLHKPTHWMPKFAGPGQCEPTTSDAVGEPVAASPYEGKMIVDAKLLHALWCYGNLHVVEGVIYSPGSHQECLAQVNALFRERATHPPASPDTSAAILAERERCAAIADEWANKMALNYGRETANTIAAAIRQLPTTERGE